MGESFVVNGVHWVVGVRVADEEADGGHAPEVSSIARTQVSLAVFIVPAGVLDESFVEDVVQFVHDLNACEAC